MEDNNSLQRFVIFRFKEICETEISGINHCFGSYSPSTYYYPNEEKSFCFSFPSDGKKLKSYFMATPMNDEAIQNVTNSVPMTERDFVQLHYSLLIDPSIGEKYLGLRLVEKQEIYLCHVILDSGETHVFLFEPKWFEGKLSSVSFNTVPIGGKKPWGKGLYFLSF